MSLYENDEYISQLADEAVAEMEERKIMVKMIMKNIAGISDPMARLALRQIMELITS